MTAAESFGSHQLNSFAAFLEEKLHTSSENSVVQIPQLKKMADGKRPQKGGKRPEVMTAFEIPDDIYAGYCTPPEEDRNQRKIRIQRIERRWACEWKEYRYVTPKYMRKFAVNPPCRRPPLAPGQVADPSSIRRGEEFPKEWAKRQRKLQKQAQEAVRKFNEESAAAAATEVSAKPRKSMMKKPARKPSASPSVPSRPSSSAAPSRPEASKSSQQVPHTAPTKSSAPPARSSAIPAKSSAHVHLATCQRTTGISIATGVSASSSAAPNSSVGPSLLKKKATDGRGTRPSPKKQVVFSVPYDDDDDDADEEELAELIRSRQERAAKAKGTPVPMLLDPRAILDYIDLWHKDPNTPMPDFKLTPGQSHMLTHFIQEEKWQYDQARAIKKTQYREEKLLKQNVVKMNPDELIKMQAEIKALSAKFDSYYADWQGAKVRFVRLTDPFTKGTTSPQIPQAEASVQPTEEHASTADDSQTTEEHASSKADDSAPAPEEIARASTSDVREETEETRATASVAPEATQPDSSAPPAPTPTPILPSALDVKKTKAAERPAVKKRKASAASESSAPKKMKPMTSSIANPIDAIPISSMPSKEVVPFDEEYVIPSGSDEETQFVASSEQIDEEIEVDAIPSTPQVSSPMPQFDAEEAGVEEIDNEDVDIGSTTPVMNDDFWESQHPNSPLFTPLQQIPHSPSPTVQIGSGDTHPAASANEEIPATSAEETAAATEQVTEPEENPENPQPEEPEIVIPEVVMQITDTPLPRPKDPFSRKQKIKAEDFYGEHVFFTEYNPYDSARIRKRRFWTASQANFYSSVLYNKDKVFDHTHIPHVDMESMPCFMPVLSVLHDAGLLNFY